jgi:hypothetical protein
MFRYKLAHTLFNLLVKATFNQDSPELENLLQEARDLEACLRPEAIEEAQVAYASWSSSEDWEKDGACPVCGCMCDGTCEGADERRRQERQERLMHEAYERRFRELGLTGHELCPICQSQCGLKCPGAMERWNNNKRQALGLVIWVLRDEKDDHEVYSGSEDDCWAYAKQSGYTVGDDVYIEEVNLAFGE